MTGHTYPRHIVTYRAPNGQTHTALLRIRSDVTDLAADARRQIVGNHCPVAEILLVERDD